MKKKSIAMLLAAALMLSLCCGSVFAQEKGSDEMEDVLDSAFIDSGEVENPEQQPHTNFTQKEGVVAKEAEVDVEALLAARNADIDIEALQEEALKLCQLKRNVKEQYLSQLSEEELQQIQERTEETLALFEDRAEKAASVYEESASEQEVMLTTASQAFSISQASIAIQDGTNAGTIKVTQGSTVFDNLNPSNTIVVITGTSDKNYVLVSTSSNRTVKITLTGVNMNNIAADTIASCITLSESSVVNLTLTGNNSIFAKQGGAGIEVPEGASLTVGGPGLLDVTAGDLGASIGGYHSNSGNITINSGTITVNSYDETGIFGSGGAGIGGGSSGGCGTITINGGKINLNGPFYISSGIGTGNSGIGGNVVITGGIIENTNEGTIIGSGAYGNLDSINISGGTITAITGGYTDASIGSSFSGNVGSIKISNGVINALSNSGAAIGAGSDGGCGSITITGGNVTAESTFQGAGIGGGCSSNQEYYGGVCGSISISNATVNAIGNYGAGIGGGGSYDKSGGTVSSISIPSGTISSSSMSGTAIGGGYGALGNGSDGLINIGSSANVTALTGATTGAINNNSGTASILNFKLLVPNTYNAVLKNSSGSIAWTTDRVYYPNKHGSFAMTIPSGNYSLYINDEKQAGMSGDTYVTLFNAAQGVNSYTSVRLDLPDEELYGRLNFAYPVPPQYTGTFDYENHLGLDISAPKNTPIYSVYTGTVAWAGIGANNGATTGYYISIVNEALDLTKPTPSKMITRYLHINTAENVYVDLGDRVSIYQEIGLVGSRGFYEGRRLNHLHIDANSSGITAGSPGSAYIPPKLFWPGRFHDATSSEEYPGYESDWGATRNANIMAQDQNSKICDLTDQELLELGGYFDLRLIKMIGSANFENWLSNHPYSTVYDLIGDFEITDKQLKETLAEHVYAAYMKYWPES